IPVTLWPLVAVAARRRQSWPFWTMVLIPLMELSSIYQKQLRYLQGIVPFVMLLATAGAVELWQRGYRRSVAALLILSTALSVSGLTFHQRKSMAAVQAAWLLSGRIAPGQRVCLSQGWAYGDRLYLRPDTDVTELPFPISPEMLEKMAPECDWIAGYSSDL